MHVPLLSYGDKASLICQLYKAGYGDVWYGDVPGKGEEVLRLRAAALEAVTFGCSEPTGDRDSWERPGDAHRPPIEIEDEREPSRLEERNRWDRTIRHLTLVRT